MSRPAVPLSDEDKLLVRHILDIAERSKRSYRALYSTFLDDRQLAMCEAALKSNKAEDFKPLGGYDGAERQVIAFGLSHDEYSEPPFSAVVFNYPADRELSHRDFLGSLMALGIKRELLGDILVGKGRTAVFVMNAALPLVMEMTKVGSCGVKITDDFTEDDIPEQEYDEIHSTVASLRLDAVVATAFRISRDKAAELIRQKGVNHNRVMTFSPSDRVSEGDRFSVRGFGKFALSEIGGQSKKDRIFITVRKYR